MVESSSGRGDTRQMQKWNKKKRKGMHKELLGCVDLQCDRAFALSGPKIFGKKIVNNAAKPFMLHVKY